jgi:branched-subunit amino acid transport protein
MNPLSTFELWGIILGGMVVTYATRLSFILLIPYEKLPDLIRRGLRFVPPAILAALILPALIRPDGPYDLCLTNHRWMAGILAAFVAWRTRNTWLTIVVGMMTLWLLNQWM